MGLYNNNNKLIGKVYSSGFGVYIVFCTRGKCGDGRA